MGELFYRIGIDVGERSVGLAAVRYNQDGLPTAVLAALSHIHDGGADPHSGQSPESRLAVSGIARRTRRLHRRRRKRLRRLDALLRELGWPVPAKEMAQTYQAWQARDRLAREYIPDETQRHHLLTLSVRHVARYRGWRNPWDTFDRVLSVAENPSPDHPEIGESGCNTVAFDAMCTAARERFPEAFTASAPRTIGQLAMLGVDRRKRVRNRGAGAVGDDRFAIFSQQIRQHDTLRELLLMLRTQRVPETDVRRIAEAVYTQERPHVPIERVGTDPLPGMEGRVRALRASLDAQEFRIRDAVANLRIRDGRNGRRTLTDDEHDTVVAFLLHWRNPERPRWMDVAAHLEIPPGDLVKPAVDQGGTSIAPTDRSSTIFESRVKKNSAVRRWWDDAPFHARAALIAYLADSSNATERDEVADLMTEWGEEAATLLSMDFESGRSAYSDEALRRLNTVMRENRCGLHEARKIAFGVDDQWRPPAPTLDDAIEHPTVQRVNTIVRRFVMSAVDTWGLPDAIVVEHVRSAFFGPAALAEHNREVESNRRERERVHQELVEQGVAQPRRGDIQRYRAITRQGSKCLYCGQPITLTTSELDHIIPRSAGGANLMENLVAACSACNKEKGDRPFITFASGSTRPGVGVDEARARLRDWTRRKGESSRSFRTFTSRVAQRLAAEEFAAMDERSIESTAFAAREMAARLRGSLFPDEIVSADGSSPDDISDRRQRVWVYRGSVTAEARKAGGIDARMMLRGARERKTRFDRRHHAIDAAVITTLSPSVARVLAERNERQYAATLTGGARSKWADYTGSSPAQRERFQHWRGAVDTLAALLEEQVAADVDRIPVVRSLRLSTRGGRAHMETVIPLDHRDVRGGLSSADIDRTADVRDFEHLIGLAGEFGDLEPDDDRRMPGDRTTVPLFPSGKPMLPIRGGACAIGDTAHHARLYAWAATDGGYRYGWVRLFAGEFPRIGFTASGVDLLTATIPGSSMAWRTANTALRRRILDGTAREIGWIAVGDELEFDADLHHFSGEMASAMTAFPERRWVVTGLMDETKVSIAPSYLAAEGLAADDALTETSMGRILQANRIRLAVNLVLSAPGCTIIRRTSLGRPRWRENGLPTSFSVHERAAGVLDG